MLQYYSACKPTATLFAFVASAGPRPDLRQNAHRNLLAPRNRASKKNKKKYQKINIFPWWKFEGGISAQDNTIVSAHLLIYQILQFSQIYYYLH